MIFLFFLVFLISYSFPKKEKEEEKIEKWSFFLPIQNERKMEKEREENTYSQGQRKEKDLVHPEMNKV